MNVRANPVGCAATFTYTVGGHNASIDGESHYITESLWSPGDETVAAFGGFVLPAETSDGVIVPWVP